MNAFLTRVAAAPKLYQGIGQAVFALGAALIVFGLIGRAGLLAANSIRSRGKLEPFQSLAEAYPTLPTWWIPEGPVGYVVALLIAAAGAWLAISAKRMVRRARSRR